MTFASTPPSTQITHPEPTQLQENKPRLERQLHRGVPDDRDRASFERGVVAAGEAEGS